jgi:hypothetical protein
VAQKTSVELDDREGYPNLEFGDFFLPAGKSWSGETGLIFVPFYYGRTYIEWLPRGTSGGTFVQDHGLLDGTDLVKKCTLAPKKKVPTVLPNGNDLIETVYWAGYIADADEYTQCVFAMASTFLAVSKEWNTKIVNYKLPGAPNYIRWCRPWRITTERQSNEHGVWALPKVALVDPGMHTFDLPDGLALWQRCNDQAKTFSGGFRLQGQDGGTTESAESELPY